MRDYALIYLNGVRKEIRGRESLMMLADWLRKEAGLTGTKIVCAEGDCGACTVLRAFPRAHQKSSQFEALNSCITTVSQMDGSHLVTIEGIQHGSELSPVQNAMRECHGSQCGYCTPGFVMALSGALERHDRLDKKTACNYLTGNLCRCTGYEPIIEAATSVKANETHSVAKRYLKAEATSDLLTHQKSSMQIQTDSSIYLAPTSLAEALQFAITHPGFRVVAAGTDLGVQTNKGKPLPQFLLSLHLIPELYDIEQSSDRIRMGARVTLSQLRRVLSNVHVEFSQFLDLFASPQIKNVATLVGNIANASPIGDTLPFLLVSNGQVTVSKWDSAHKKIQQRDIALTDLYLGYKKLALDPSEIITHVAFKLPHPTEIIKVYKVSQRKDLDISTVSAAFSIEADVENPNPVITRAKVAYGGVAATPVRVPEAEQALVGKVLTPLLVAEVAELIGKVLKPQTDLRGSAKYRTVLARNLFKKFGAEVLGG